MKVVSLRLIMVKGYQKSIDKLKTKLSAIGLLSKSGELEKEKMIEAGVDESTIRLIERRLAGESYAEIGASIDEKGFPGRSYLAVKLRIYKGITLYEMFTDRRNP